jgi:mRNA interferase YafQ
LLEIKYSSRFKKDYKKLKYSGRYNIKSLDILMEKKAGQIPLDQSNEDHQLQGYFSDFRECHIEPDWLLIYKLDVNYVTFTRTGSHSELFG